MQLPRPPFKPIHSQRARKRQLPFRLYDKAMMAAVMDEENKEEKKLLEFISDFGDISIAKIR
jgi:hypothetical protein